MQLVMLLCLIWDAWIGSWREVISASDEWAMFDVHYEDNALPWVNVIEELLYERVVH